MVKYFRTILVTFLLSLFAPEVIANESEFDSKVVNTGKIQYYWQDKLNRLQLEYLRGLDAYASKDYGTAYDIWLPMAKDGFSYAQADIGGLYFNGWGAKRDYETAFLWYERAAINNNTYAQYMMGNLYWNGQGVHIHTDLAQVWWELAADKGYKDAQFALPYQYCYLNHPNC